jgi:hypothetical protein
MQITVPVPTFNRRVCVPLPSLTRKQLLFMGGAATLGIADVLSAPVAAVVAAAPLLQKGLRRIAASAESDGAGSGAGRRSPARRTSSPGGRSTARSDRKPTARTTRRPAARSSRRATATSTTSGSGTA